MMKIDPRSPQGQELRRKAETYRINAIQYAAVNISLIFFNYLKKKMTENIEKNKSTSSELETISELGEYFTEMKKKFDQANDIYAQLDLDTDANEQK